MARLQLNSIAVTMLAILVIQSSVSAQPDDKMSLSDRVQQLEQQVAGLQSLLAINQQEAKAAKKYEEDYRALRDYLKSKNLWTDFLSWREDRSETQLDERKRQLEESKAREDEGRERRVQARVKEQRRQEEAEQKKEIQKANAPRWHYTYQLGWISRAGHVTYVDFERGEVWVGETDLCDRNNVMVRGTFTNKSASPYRYTFVAKVFHLPKLAVSYAARDQQIGSWRYQTPILQANELHQFEIKVPVSDSLLATGANLFEIVGQ